MFVFVGGDRRAYWTVQFLREWGIPVCSYDVPDLEDSPLPNPISVLLLPFPTVLPEDRILQLMEHIQENSIIIGGKLDPLREKLIRTGAQVHDLYDTEPLTTLNAAATAEGALHLLIGASETTLAGSKCLVIGSGRIGMLLGEKLHSLGARVTIAARSEKSRGMIRAKNMLSEKTGVYHSGLELYDSVINTVPAPVLNREQLSRLKKDCIVLELASSPGGFSREDCKALSIKEISAPGLPGRFSPKTAGILYGESILKCLKEEGIL